MRATEINEISVQPSIYRTLYHYSTSAEARKMCGQLVLLTLLKLHAAVRKEISLQSITH